jgi:hypothetical protein
MRIVAAMGITAVLTLGAAARAHAQTPAQATATASVPRLITVSGTYQPASGQPAPPGTVVTLSVYADASGGAPLFQETQDVTLDAAGRYVVQLGATYPDGLPVSLFADGKERWLAVQFAGLGETEKPRTRLTSVPYALRAADAETLGGHPASAYVLAPNASGNGSSPSGSSNASTANASTPPPANVVNTGTPNALAKYVNTTDVGSSAVTEVNGSVGIGTTTPADFLHVRYTNTNGGLTGFAVQNLGNTNTSYSGMLFYDQFGALGQFQGFNNVTHEYRINNIATNGANYNGSINFMIGTTSRFLVTSNGNIGIGTDSPSPGTLLEVSNKLVPNVPSNVLVSSYTNLPLFPYFGGRRARGTWATPTAVQNGDGLSGLLGVGYGATQFGAAAGIIIQAAQNFTDTAQGTAITFSTTPLNSTTPATRMMLDAVGHLGIGTGTTSPVSFLEVSNAASPFPTPTVTTTSSFTGTIPFGSFFIGRKARGTAAAPTAVQNGDGLAAFTGAGYGATGFGGGVTGGGMFVQAAENWSDTAQGTSLAFNTTPNGTTTATTSMTITGAGDVGVGTSTPAAALEVVRSGDNAGVIATTFNGGLGSAQFMAQTARGTAAAPHAVALGDELGFLGGNGYGTTHFSGRAGGMDVVAAENWTDAAMGSLVAFFTTPLGATGHPNGASVAIMPDGSVGIGAFTQIPTIADRLQVFGDIRVGTTGTNGCLKDFGGNVLAGTCASDRRYKKGITPFGPALERVAALQPVHFYWRADEFPEHHFGDSQAYGLIAQEVEQVLPELVVTHEDGYKAVDYSKLPLLTIQAVKELKAQSDEFKKANDELKASNDELKASNQDLARRVAALEQLIRDVRTNANGGVR